MGEWAGGSHAGVQAQPTDELRIHPLDALDGAKNHFRIAEIHTTVAVEIVHPAVAVVVDDDVRRVTELMATRPRRTFTDEAGVVVRRAESAQHAYVLRRHTCGLHSREDELELVEKRFSQDDVFRPDTILVVRQEVAQREMR